MSKKKNNLERGIYHASVVSLKKAEGRCLLKLHIYEQTSCISIDIHDEICETSGLSYISKEFIKSLRFSFPSEVKISNHNGFWKVENLNQILSDCIIKII